MNKVKLIKCLACKDEFNYYSSKSRPFCSERCKTNDLGKWLRGDYQLKSEENLSDEDLEKVLHNLENEED